MSTNPRDDERLAQISGAGIGPKNIRSSLFPADDPDQFMHRAIHGDEDEQKDLNGEEMRPDDYREQLLIAGDKAARLPPEID